MGRDNVFKELLLFRMMSLRIFAKLSLDIWGGVSFEKVDDMMLCINYYDTEMTRQKGKQRAAILILLIIIIILIT